MIQLAPIAAALGRVPPKVWIAGAVLALLVYYRLDARSTKAEFAKAKVQAEVERKADEAKNATEHARRVHAIQEAADAATLQAQSDRVAAAAAAGAADRLRQRVAALQAGARGTDPAAAGRCEAAVAATDLLADVQRRIDEAAGQLAEHADAARTAGQACERAYEALTPKQSPY